LTCWLFWDVKKASPACKIKRLVRVLEGFADFQPFSQNSFYQFGMTSTISQA
jgi:hypothetical protein